MYGLSGSIIVPGTWGHISSDETLPVPFLEVSSSARTALRDRKSAISSCDTGRQRQQSGDTFGEAPQTQGGTRGHFERG
ncbi:MAG: hypothetical protein DMG64_19130 [Acidobacteria bacterium]|nr:MAG: hypothetical protein DMG64_19130 [Acidobacteriota bacterium]